MAAEQPRLIVIGGGAAGFFGAIRAKSLNPALDVLILEAAPKCLGKVKISGGGRCNVTHACFDKTDLVRYYPRGQRELKGVFSRFAPQDTVKWFESQGVRLKTEPDGRMFPITDDSQTVIDALLNTALQLKIKIQTKAPVRSICITDGRLRVESDGRIWEADVVLMASGSACEGYRMVESLGHSLIPPVPSLFTFCSDDPTIRDLAGVSFPHVKGKLDVSGEKPILQEGPLLITHWGVSGPVVLRLSAWGARMLHDHHYKGTLRIDFCPEWDQEALRQALIDQKQQTPKKQIMNESPVTMPKRFWHRLLGISGIDPERPWADVPQKPLNQLAERLKGYPLPIQGKGVFKDEFVTAGGVPLNEIDMKTMQSKLCPGLFLAGEIINVDGLTGGFNFQNAWSTGWIAGEGIASLIMEQAV